MTISHVALGFLWMVAAAPMARSDTAERVSDRLSRVASSAFAAGRYSDAIAFWTLALREIESGGAASVLAATTHGSLAEAYSARGDYLRAVESRERALHLLGKSDHPPAEILFRFKQGQAYDLDHLGRHKEAEGLWLELLADREKTGQRSAYAETLAMYGDHLARSSRPTKAAEVYQQAVQVKRVLGEECGYVIKRRADSLAASGQLSSAIEAYAQAFSEVESLPSILRSHWLEDLGDLHLQQRNARDAAASYQAALSTLAGEAPREVVLLHKLLEIARSEGNHARIAALSQRFRGALDSLKYDVAAEVRDPVFLAEPEER